MNRLEKTILVIAGFMVLCELVAGSYAIGYYDGVAGAVQTRKALHRGVICFRTRKPLVSEAIAEPEGTGDADKPSA